MAHYSVAQCSVRRFRGVLCLPLFLLTLAPGLAAAPPAAAPASQPIHVPFLQPVELPAQPTQLAPRPPRVAVPSAATAPASQPAADPAAIRALITQLGDLRLERRQAALQALTALGDAALPYLRAALATTPDAEIRSHCEQLLAQADQREARRLRLIGGQLYTLRFRHEEGKKTEVWFTDRQARRLYIQDDSAGLQVTVTTYDGPGGAPRVERSQAASLATLKHLDRALITRWLTVARANSGLTAEQSAFQNPEWDTEGVAGWGRENDLLPVLRVRLQGQMRAARTPPDRQAAILALLDRLARLRPVFEPPGPLFVDPLDGDNDPGPLEGIDSADEAAVWAGTPELAKPLYALADELWPQLDALGLTDPEGALPPRSARRLGVILFPETLAPDPKTPDAYLSLPGISVVAVAPNSRAARMGLQRDDTLLAPNGQPLTAMSDLRRLVSQTQGPLTLVVRRAGKRLELREPTPAPQPAPPRPN